MRARMFSFIGAVALAASLLVAPVGTAAPVVTTAATARAVFTSSDVGFAEGSATAGLVDRLDAMKSYVGGRSPIIRLDLDWQGVQPTAGSALDFSDLDPIVDAANTKGIRVLIILGYSATWANGGKPINWFPTDDAAWRSVVAGTVAHFGSKVTAYEVWNEPNFAKFGQYGDQSVGARQERYWQLVKIASQAVRSGCSTCTVLAGRSGAGDVTSSSGTENRNEPRLWLDYAYKNPVGSTTKYASYFDAVAHHPYPAWNSGLGPSAPECTNRWWNMFGPPDPACGELAAVRAVMAANADSAKKIWATEFGYPTAGSGITSRTPAQIRDFMEEGVRNWRALDYTGPLFIYSYQDSPGCAPSTDPECHFGLTTTTGAPKQPIFDDVKRALNDTWLPRLDPGRSLHRRSSIRSTDGRFQLWLQDDGNLVLYLGSTVLWKVDNLKGVTLTNRTDGNLVLLNGAGTVVWSTNTANRGPSDLDLQNDGNLVLTTRTSPPAVSWSSGTWGH